MKRIVPVLAAVVVCAGCSRFAGVPLPGPRGQASEYLERKMVADKIAPNELVAADASRCITDASRFRRIQTGQRVWCVWSGNALDPNSQPLDGRRTAGAAGDAPPVRSAGEAVAPRRERARGDRARRDAPPPRAPESTTRPPSPRPRKPSS